MKRVVITGAGTINALGHSVPATLAAMREGVCGIGPLVLRDVERLSIQIGGQVRGFETEGLFNRQQMSLYDRFTQFTLSAAKEADFFKEQEVFINVNLGSSSFIISHSHHQVRNRCKERVRG